MHLNKCVLQIYMYMFLESESYSTSNNMKFDNNTRVVFLACNCLFHLRCTSFWKPIFVVSF